MRTVEERAVRLWAYVEELLDLHHIDKALKLARLLVMYEHKKIRNKRGTITGDAAFNRWRDLVVIPAAKPVLLRLAPIVNEETKVGRWPPPPRGSLPENPGSSR